MLFLVSQTELLIFIHVLCNNKTKRTNILVLWTKVASALEGLSKDNFSDLSKGFKVCEAYTSLFNGGFQNVLAELRIFPIQIKYLNKISNLSNISFEGVGRDNRTWVILEISRLLMIVISPNVTRLMFVY